MKRKITFFACLVIAMSCFVGCGYKKEDVKLTLWGSENSQKMLAEIVEDFKELYKDEAEFEITLGIEGENTLAENVEMNPQAAADVFLFADDQMSRLMALEILLPITEDTDEIIQENGGADSAAIECCSNEGQLYAYPLTASNGYFMYYNAEYFTEDDVKCLDTMLSKADEAGKKICMDWSSGWYIFSFFQGAGLTLSFGEDGIHNECNWNATDTNYTGVQVAQAMLDISSHDSFTNYKDAQFLENLGNGDIIAVVNGTWNSNAFSEAWGENYRAAKLPTYTIAGNQVQMGSFIGYKLVGVNANSKYPKWAMRLARFVSNEENQMKRFYTLGEGPANVKAAASKDVQSSQAIAALEAQAPYAIQQKVAEPFWIPATVFGTVMAAGNPDGRDLQELLDELVEQACADPASMTN